LSKLRFELEDTFDDITVVGFIGRRGSFEVTDDTSGKVYHSKLKSGEFPDASNLIAELKKAL